jgi:hypothetical protein
MGDKAILAFALGVLSGYLSLPRGDLKEARAYAEESAQHARAIGMSWAEAQAHTSPIG